jgi:hypothetical protein
MIKSAFAATLFTAVVFGNFVSNANAAAPVACEDMLKKLDDSMKTAKLNDADMKSVTELKAKAEERCKSEDDRRSDEFVDQALKLIVKK